LRTSSETSALSGMGFETPKPGDTYLKCRWAISFFIIILCRSGQWWGWQQVTRAAFPDPTDPRWIAVEIRPLSRFVQPIPLARIKADPRFADFALVRQARLSVMPVPPPLADILLEWGQPISL
jgi:predicted RNA-binding protein with PUA-like domain